MRVSHQLIAGYLLAVAAILAAVVLSYFHLHSVSQDVEEIGEEWRESDIWSRALAAIHAFQLEPGNQQPLVEAVAGLQSMFQREFDEELNPGENPLDEHSRLEGELAAELSVILARAADATPEELDALEEQAHHLSSAFWEEDRDRIPRSLAEIDDRGSRLRALNLGVGAVLVLLPLLFFFYMRRTIIGPLAAIQARVSSLGGGAGESRSTGMSELGETIERMAQTFEERRRSLEEQVETRTQQLRHADRLGGLGKIAAAVAHEINNPLGSMGLCLDGMKRTVADQCGEQAAPGLDPYFDTLHREIDRCTAITRKMLTYARYRPTDLEEISVGQLVQGTLELVSVHARRARVWIAYSNGAAHARIHGEVGQLQQVIVNLLLNAIDASPSGEAVSIDAVEENGYVHLSVADRGPGVVAEDRERIFEPFVTTKRAGEGTGLGLAIAREIVEAHGGTLDLVDSELGAAFEISLPALASQEARA